MTEIICIIDRSGSMEPLRDDAIGGFNAFLSEQRKLGGAALVTLILFDQEHRTLYAGVEVREAPPLDASTYVPRGGTALLDAIGAALASTDSRPKVVCILTDGQENASREYGLAQVRQMIESRRKEGWTFHFLSAAPDTFTTAQQLSMTSSGRFERSRDGVTGAFTEISRLVTSSRKLH